MPIGTRKALNFGGGSMPSVGAVVTEATAGVSSKSEVSESEPKTAWMALHVAGLVDSLSLVVNDDSESEASEGMTDGSVEG